MGGEVVVNPGRFDHATCCEVLGDLHVKRIEGKARVDADSGIEDISADCEGSYWDKVIGCMVQIVYSVQYIKRSLRNDRLRSGS